MLLALLALFIAAPAPPEPACTITMSSSGRTFVRIADAHLRYDSVTPTRDPRRAGRQSMEAYDRHSIERDLTPAERARVHAWIDAELASLPGPPDGRRSPPTYGSAFGRSLDIACGERAAKLTWCGDSTWSDAHADARLGHATRSLIALCDEFARATPMP